MRSAQELERRGIAAYLAGDDDACEELLQGAHRAADGDGDAATAVRCAFWLVMVLMLRGRFAEAGGWLARGERSAAGADDCPTAGYLLVPATLRALGEGDHGAAIELARRIEELGDRHGDADLRAFGILGNGQALLAGGDIEAGTARLDEVMVAVRAGELGTAAAGIVYCAVILSCMNLFDLARASEWTEALTEWCEARPGLVPYRGQCLVHRSQLQQAAGDWATAASTAAAARARLAQPPHPALGLADYQVAELHRLVGEAEQAAEAYREASRHGHDPMPGLALLSWDQGDLDAAVAAIRRALIEKTDCSQRPVLLAAAVDILRAAGEHDDARRAAGELDALASGSHAAALRAMADHAVGATQVDGGDVGVGLTRLRIAAQTWQALRMPYEWARTAVELARGCRALGDANAAALELDNAWQLFASLGAAPDLARLDAPGVVARAAEPRRSQLSAREREVLGHLAAGQTNREIAATLVVSEHTVRRHVENIFTKLGVNSRAAATAHAYQHDLLPDR